MTVRPPRPCTAGRLGWRGVVWVHRHCHAVVCGHRGGGHHHGHHVSGVGHHVRVAGWAARCGEAALATWYPRTSRNGGTHAHLHHRAHAQPQPVPGARRSTRVWSTLGVPALLCERWQQQQSSAARLPIGRAARPGAAVAAAVAVVVLVVVLGSRPPRLRPPRTQQRRRDCLHDARPIPHAQSVPTVAVHRWCGCDAVTWWRWCCPGPDRCPRHGSPPWRVRAEGVRGAGRF